jgi:hypothetical protein
MADSAPLDPSSTNAPGLIGPETAPAQAVPSAGPLPSPEMVPLAGPRTAHRRSRHHRYACRPPGRWGPRGQLDPRRAGGNPHRPSARRPRHRSASPQARHGGRGHHPVHRRPPAPQGCPRRAWRAAADCSVPYPDGPLGARARAMLLLGFGAALRRSELVASASATSKTSPVAAC